MSVLQQKNILELDNNGYSIIQSRLEPEIILKAQTAFKSILNKVEKKEYNYYRVYDDYSLVPNISGIEMVFHPNIINQDIIDFITDSKLLDIAKEILGEDIYLELSRYHLTQNYSHVGIWHRDASITDPQDAIQLNIFLFDEQGLQVVDSSHKEDAAISAKEIIDRPFIYIKNSRWVETKAGDILVFNPAVLHRGISAFPRANLHFRFRKKNNLHINKNEKNKLNLYIDKLKFTDDWKNVLDAQHSQFVDANLKEFNFKNNIRFLILRIIRNFIHNFIFFLSFESKLYSVFWVKPNLRLRTLFKLKI
jgi:ectoine hydroxylase-related dioxygenase (phytanoyl-CoA dioxygenase family)